MVRILVVVEGCIVLADQKQSKCMHTMLNSTLGIDIVGFGLNFTTKAWVDFIWHMGIDGGAF